MELKLPERGCDAGQQSWRKCPWVLVSPHLCRLEKESEMMVAVVEARDLNHWTSGEVPMVPGF